MCRLRGWRWRLGTWSPAVCLAGWTAAEVHVGGDWLEESVALNPEKRTVVPASYGVGLLEEEVGALLC